MPTVRSGPRRLKEFPYTKKGIKDAEAYAKKHNAVVMNTMGEMEQQKKEVLNKIANVKGDHIPTKYEGYSIKDLPPAYKESPSLYQRKLKKLAKK